MCGIFGLIQSCPFNATELVAMSELIKHRGPDDEGFVIFGKDFIPEIYGGKDTPDATLNDHKLNWLPKKRLSAGIEKNNGGLVLGHRRLSIIELSAYGHQPMSTRSGRYWITYNGEIYNYKELREELRSHGHNFFSDSDTEVILAAYSQWGYGCLDKLNGMWAFVIFDKHTNNLFMARDRFGIKPLYYWNEGKQLAFASEIKCFTGMASWKPKVNKERLLQYLVWGVSDHTEQTMFEDVFQLPAGSYAVLNLSGVILEKKLPEIIPQQWYQLEEIASKISGYEAVDGLRSVLVDSVKKHLRADVPVGSCLSGGLDSSSIACIIEQQMSRFNYGSQRLHTFTARSEDFHLDEYKYADKVIKRINANSHVVTPEPNGLFSALDQLIWHQDEPFGSTSIYAQWCVFQSARANGIKVVLDGQGADEVLAGYAGFIGAYLASLLRNGFVADWCKAVDALNREGTSGLIRSIGYTCAYLMPRAWGLFGRFDGRAFSKKNWITKKYRDVFDNNPLTSFGGFASVEKMSIAQIKSTNLPMLLHWEDRNSMAHSIEARVPFLDHHIVEFCIAITSDEKISNGVMKAVLRKAMRGVVPDIVLDRRDKLGFVTAESRWFTRDEPQKFKLQLLAATDRLKEIITPELNKDFDNMLLNRSQYDSRYWRTMCAARWASLHNILM